MNDLKTAMQRASRRYIRDRKTTDGIEFVKRALPRAPFVLGAIVAALALPLVLMLALRTDTEIAEWWTRHIQAGWEKAIGALTSWLPFSVLEFFIVVGIILGAYLLVRLFLNLCSARFYRATVGALAVCIGLMYVLNIYVVSMGFGYYRKAMPVPQSGKDYTEAQTVAAVEYFLNDYNALAEDMPRDKNGCVVCPYSFSQLATLLKQEYARMDDGYFASYTPTVKPVVNSSFMSDMMITGITFLPFGEACVNTEAPPSEIPLTMAHELAHAKGVQREGDANLLARYVLLSSQNDYLRYCGYYGSFYNLLSAVALHENDDEYKRLYNAVHSAVTLERRYAYSYWNAQPDFIGDISDFFNDIYLKLNGALNGTGSYNDGNISDVEISKDPETGEEERKIYYSQTQMLYFYLYEKAVHAL